MLSTLPTSVNCGAPPCLPCVDGLNLVKTMSQNKLFLLGPSNSKIMNTMAKMYLCVSCLSSLNQIPRSLFLLFTFQYKLEIN